MEKLYDIVVYGASGFTGQYAAVEMARTCKGKKKMAISGRSESKLLKVLDFIEQELGEPSIKSEIAIIVADNKDEESIRDMCRKCKAVVNCVGPFRWFGELVVRSCVEMSAHYVDISGEPEFLQMCQIKYHEEANQKGIHIVGACGFDSIPADVGLELLREKFPGQLTAAESYIHLYGSGKANFGTYNTIIQSLASKSNIKGQQREIFKGKRLPYVGAKLATHGVSFSESENRWFVPFKGADPSVVRRTQLYESITFEKTPLQYASYFTVPSFLALVGTIMFAMNIYLFTRFKIGIKLLQTFPKFFSFGVFSKEGVDRETLNKGGFYMMFHGQGYSKPVNSMTSEKPDQRLSLKFSGPECGYLFTSIAAVAGARTLLDDKLVNVGGVLTAATAFKNSGFVSRLEERGVKIDVIQKS